MTILLKDVIFEDTVNYKKTCMTLEMPFCSMKCDKECGKPVCQNGALASLSSIEVDAASLIRRYLSDHMVHALCFQGLEPFDSWMQLAKFILMFRKHSDDDIVIYTGYNKCEIQDKLHVIENAGRENVYVKFGRYVPNQEPHYDDVLGVYLASDNQYGERIC